MIRFATLSAFLLTSFFSHSQTSNPDTWNKVKASKSGTIKVLQFDQPKFAAVNPTNNKFEGFCVDLLDDFIVYLKTEKQVTLTYEVDKLNSDFSKAYQLIREGSGGTFGIGAVAINEQRKKEIIYTEAYLTLGLVLISSPTAPTLTSLEDIGSAFEGYTAYAEKGTVSEAELLKVKRKYLPNLIIKNAKSNEVLHIVATEEKTFAYAGISDLLGSMQKGLKHHKVGNLKGTEVGFILPMGSDWKEIFDEFFTANGGYKNSDRFKSSLFKHFGSTGYKLIASMQ